MESWEFGVVTRAWSEIHRVRIENHRVLFVGVVGVSQKLFSPKCWGLLWALGRVSADPVGLSLQRVMTRSPLTPTTSSPTSRWSTTAGGEGSARAATASSPPTTWNSGSRATPCCSCLNSPAHTPLLTLQTDHEAFPRMEGVYAYGFSI